MDCKSLVYFPFLHWACCVRQVWERLSAAGVPGDEDGLTRLRANLSPLP